MFTNVIIALDGSKFITVNNKKDLLSKKAKDLIARFDASISHYLTILADKDKQEYFNEDVIVMHEKVALMKNRLTELADIEAIVDEHPFNTIKMWIGAIHYLTKRLKNVSTETNLHVLTYDLKRMMPIKATIGLMKAIRE